PLPSTPLVRSAHIAQPAWDVEIRIIPQRREIGGLRIHIRVSLAGDRVDDHAVQLVEQVRDLEGQLEVVAYNGDIAAHREIDPPPRRADLRVAGRRIGDRLVNGPPVALAGERIHLAAAELD